MGKIQKRNTGITLVALVVTIIVLVILAGISLSILASENGIFKIAQQATKNYTNEQNEEEIKLEKYNEYISSTRENKLRIEDDDLIAWINSSSQNIVITLEDVINGTLVNKLMLDKSAVDYMMTNERILQKVLESENAIIAISKSDYASYKMYLDEESWNIIQSSSCASEFNQNRKLVDVSSDTVTFEGNGNNNALYAFGNRPSSSNYYGWNPAGEGASPLNRYASIKFTESNYIVYKYSFATHASNTSFSKSAKINIIGRLNDGEWDNLVSGISVAYSGTGNRTYSGDINYQGKINQMGIKFTSSTAIRQSSGCGYTHDLQFYGFKIDN